ncbi:hypothetical protein SSA02_21460 [Swaminathania salitolerans]|uniref:DUF4440 domain-containing protein n=1 Tax=Swaminathania salitolerans TaxID=182838 RepID=A0A511BT29_9PROT|nr:hypothetical protein SSA02_21460 [Swaminathania salitolerans]
MLDALFSASPSTIRLGATENLFGPDEIAAFRRARKGGAPRRTRLRREIVALGPDAGCVTIIFRTEPDGRTGRQTQSWIREGESWRILVAHVSFLS